MTSDVDDLMLCPRPRRIERLGAWVTLAHDAQVSEFVEGRAGPHTCAGQAYELRVAEVAGTGRVEIRAASPAGLQFARATLAQLRRRFGDRLPALEIRDEPAFAVRGVMLDVSRNRIPTMPEFDRIIATLAAFKFNHLQLYTEHTFAYAGHEEVWRGWSPITPGEVRSLDATCQRHGIELAANQNCFGHLASWLRHERYAPLAETHGEWIFDVWPRSGPFSLCPIDPRSRALVDDLLGQLLPCISSTLVNIGCDETFDVGCGRSREAVAARGKAAIYADFVAHVCASAHRLGKRPMFWADIALSHPEVLARLPSDLIALAWGYEPDAPFDRWCEQVAASRPGREVWVCPGTSSWRSITGRSSERRENLTRAGRLGATGSAGGYLVCDWGDTGHHQQWPIALHGLANASDAAWSAGTADFDPAAAALHGLVAPDSPRAAAEEVSRARALGPWLEALGDADLPLRETCLGLSRPGHSGRLRNQSALFIDLHNHAGTSGSDVGALPAWEAARDRILRASATLPAGLPEQVDAELRHTLDVARLAGDRAVARRSLGGMSAAARAEFAGQLDAITHEHRRLWLRRSREGGLDASCSHYQRLAREHRTDAG
ncbi:MAG: family 20 glycosylhydrolase [Phycisphaerales bacterium]